MQEFNFLKYNSEPNEKCEHLLVETVDIKFTSVVCKYPPAPS